MTKVMTKHQPLFVEWYMHGQWYGTQKTSHLAPASIEEAHAGLAATAEKYFYPSYLNGRVRYSFLEPGT